MKCSEQANPERQKDKRLWGAGERGASEGQKDENVLKWAMGMAAQLREHTQAAELHASNG